MPTCASGAIDWRSKQWLIVVQSSKKSEFLELSFCVKDVLSLYKFMKHFEQVMDSAVVTSIFNVIIAEDNHACLAHMPKDGFPELSKHVDLKYHLVIEHVRKGDVCVEFVSSEEMVADLMTNNLSVQKSLPLRVLLGLQ